MGLKIYSPNAKVTGGVLDVSFNSKDGAAFFRATKQTGWDDEKKLGSFKEGQSIGMKFSQDELGSFVYAIRNKQKISLYHRFDDSVTTINFSYYLIEAKGTAPAREGFGLSIKSGDFECKIGLSMGVAEKFAQYIEFMFFHIFSAIYAADKKAFEERQAAKPNPKSSKKTKSEPEPDQEPEGETQDSDPEPESEPDDF